MLPKILLFVAIMIFSKNTNLFIYIRKFSELDAKEISKKFFFFLTAIFSIQTNKMNFWLIIFFLNIYYLYSLNVDYHYHYFIIYYIPLNNLYFFLLPYNLG